MRAYKFYLCILFFIIFVSACTNKPDAIDSKGNPIKLSEYHGKWLIINYWATWCKPCLKELPEFNNFYNSHKNQVAILGVNFDHLSNTEIQQFANKVNVSFPLLSDFPSQKLGIGEITTLPVTFIISPDGKLVDTLHGPQTQLSLLKVTGLTN